MYEYRVVETVCDYMEHIMNTMGADGYRVISTVHTGIDKRNVFITFERKVKE